ncbi:hypothetical protein ACFWZR_12410 [Streptomyces sp. NPDC059017]|uniref:hypothetical protein n=1 Tax=unclassified Streptomyces TaxID=2593676 RepID=UPI0036D0C323
MTRTGRWWTIAHQRGPWVMYAAPDDDCPCCEPVLGGDVRAFLEVLCRPLPEVGA